MDQGHFMGCPAGAAFSDFRRPRVLVIGGSLVPDCMERHVLDALRTLGCSTEFVRSRPTMERLGRVSDAAFSKLANMFIREPERLSESRILDAVSRFSPSLVLVILGAHLSPKTVALLRQRTTAPIVCWCQDQMTTLGRQYLLGSGYDAVFVKDRYMQDLFSRMIRSSSFFYLPEACNPTVHRPISITEEERKHYGCDVSIAGTLYYYRHEILRNLSEFDLKVWGNAPDWLVNRLGQQYMGREIRLDEKAKSARAARIALNTLHFAEIDGLNCRAFELAGCGAFQLITSRPVLAEHFVPDQEVATFASIDELLEKIRHYLKNPHAAESIARKGQLRAHRDHTYEVRLKEIFRLVLGMVPKHEQTINPPAFVDI